MRHNKTIYLIIGLIIFTLPLQSGADQSTCLDTYYKMTDYVKNVFSASDACGAVDALKIALTWSEKCEQDCRHDAARMKKIMHDRAVFTHWLAQDLKKCGH